MKYLLDTNVLSEPVQPRPNPQVVRRIARHQREVATASIVWHELLHGTARLPASARRTLLEDYLAGVGHRTPILPYDEAAAAWHAKERARLFQRTPPFRDGLIAAVAAVHGLTLVTANTKDFAMYQGLSVEDWGRP